MSGRRAFALLSILALALLLLVAFLSSSILDRHAGVRIRLGGRDFRTLKPETLRFVAGLGGKVDFTYFVSSRDAMPSSLKEIESGVSSLLRALKAAAPEHVDYRILDPGMDAEGGARYASARSASPVKVERILRDASEEQTIWSSLVISYDKYNDALIQGITPGDLPYLEDLIVENLKGAASPFQPTIAISSPSRGFSMLPGLVTSLAGARVVACNPGAAPGIPPEADVLFWIEPASASAEQAESVKRFLRSGRTVILAGSTYAVDSQSAAGAPVYRVRRSPCDWKAFLRPFGLEMITALVADKRHEPIAWKTGDPNAQKIDAAHQLRVFPSQTDTRSLLGPSAGALVVTAVSPLQLDPKLLESNGLEGEVVSTTSELTTLQPLPEGDFGDDDFKAGEPVPKQPWLVLVSPKDPWSGHLLVAGSASLFHDDIYAQGGNANQVFLRTLLRTFTAAPRLARIRVPRSVPEPLPALSLRARIGWRIATVFFLPAALLLFSLRRRGGVSSTSLLESPRLKRVVLAALAFVLLLPLLGRLGARAGPSLDLTEDRTNTPSPLVRQLLEKHREGLAAEIVASDSSRMPASLKNIERRLIESLRSLGIPSRITRPEDLQPAEQSALRASGIEPFEVDRVEDDASVPVRVWCAVKITQGGKTEAVPRIDARSVKHFEYLLASAVMRFDAKAPLVGVLSDLPRLSPGEAHSEYQEKGYTAPIGSDVYSFAKSLLGRYGYRVSYINPETPIFPEGMDLLLILQPRYPQRSFAQLCSYMAGGGKAIIALQHYNIQQNQFRGTGFQTVYWPQPQFHGLNEYLKLLGVRQVGEKQGEQPGEILFDRNHASMTLDTRVNRSAFREHDSQEVSRPFLILALAGGLSRASVVTSRLGELLFIWGSRFLLDPTQLARLGISATTLVATSSHAWTYAWSGGNIPEASFEEPKDHLDGPQPLAVLLEGRFPPIEIKKDETGRDSLVLQAPPAGAGGNAGKLLLIGCSEMFKNGHIYSPGYQHDQFLLSSVAFLAHGPEMAAVQAHVRAPKSFPYQPPDTKLALRVVAIGLAPLCLLLGGFLHSLRRRRPVLKD